MEYRITQLSVDNVVLYQKVVYPDITTQLFYTIGCPVPYGIGRYDTLPRVYAKDGTQLTPAIKYCLN